jgi:hypothetical protein
MGRKKIPLSEIEEEECIDIFEKDFPVEQLREIIKTKIRNDGYHTMDQLLKKLIELLRMNLREFSELTGIPYTSLRHIVYASKNSVNFKDEYIERIGFLIDNVPGAYISCRKLPPEQRFLLQDRMVLQFLFQLSFLNKTERKEILLGEEIEENGVEETMPEGWQHGHQVIPQAIPKEMLDL